MPETYSIYVLDENLMTITGTSGGNGLDGINQGTGAHLRGATITLNSRAWQPVRISDNDGDRNFQDNDTSQRTLQSYTFNNQTFAANTIVEAEYSITVQDPSGNVYTLVAFNFRTGSPPSGTIEGLAFIGPPGGFPPVGVPLRVTGNREGPNFAASSYATPICFAAGTRIATPDGEAAIETLAVGDLVCTQEGGAEPVRWIGKRRFPAEGRLAPVVFAPGVIGNTRQLVVSRQHRLLVRGWRAELVCGTDSVWVPAKHFLGRPGVHLREGGEVTYLHLLLDGHRTLLAEGVEAESLHPGDLALGTLGAEALAEVQATFPEALTFARRETSYPAVRASEARVVCAA